MAEKEGRWGLEGLGPRRKAAGYTQASFAEALGIERGRYSMWESCAVWPSAQWLRPMAALLGCSVEDLYDVPEKETDCHTSAAALVRNDNGGGASAPTENSITQDGGEGHAGDLPESVL